MRSKIASIILSFAMTMISLVAYAEGAKTSSGVVFLPFDARNAGQYTILKDGLRNMLSGRLALKEGIVVLENTLSVEEQKRFFSTSPLESSDLFKKLGTDFIATGIMIAQDRDLLLQVDFYPENGVAPVSEIMHVDNEQQIIEGIDAFSGQIAEKVFGHKPAIPIDKIAVEKNAGIEAFRTEHPDKKYKEQIVSGSAVVGSTSDTSIYKGDLMRRKSALPTGVISLAVGDGDGDGINEIFVASGKDLRIYHYERGILKQLADFVFAPSTEVHALYVSDINGDGSVEIYVSAIARDINTTGNDIFSSMIFTWSPNTGLLQKVKGIRWGIRPLQLPEKGLVLAGQAKSKGILTESFLAPGIFVLKMEAESKRFSAGEKIFLPKSLNLFDFVLADIDGDGGMEKVAITSRMKMAIFDQDNSMVWLSEADYGGSPKYLGRRWRGNEGTNQGSAGSDNENLQDLEYVPTKLIAMDVNNDGKTDIISAKNVLSTFRVLSNLRGFSSGNVVGLGWDGTKMTEIWESDRLNGYISDFDFIEHIDNKSAGVDDESGAKLNRVKLYVGHIPSSSFANLFSISGKKGDLVAYEFNIIEKSKIEPAVEQSAEQ